MSEEAMMPSPMERAAEALDSGHGTPEDEMDAARAAVSALLSDEEARRRVIADVLYNGPVVDWQEAQQTALLVDKALQAHLLGEPTNDR